MKKLITIAIFLIGLGVNAQINPNTDPVTFNTGVKTDTIIGSKDRGLTVDYIGSKVFFDSIDTQNKYAVILEIGQSNMVGIDGDNSDSNFPFPSENGSKYWNESQNDTVVLTTTRGGVNGSMSNYYADKFYSLSGIPSIIINTAKGGTAMDASADSGNGNWGATGNRRSITESTVNTALTTLGINKLTAIFWLQGMRDAKEMDANPSYTRDEALQNMIDIIEWLKSTYPNTPIFISELGGFNNNPDSQGLKNMRWVHRTVSENYKGVYLAYNGAKTFPEKGYMVDNVHYSWQGYKLVGEAYAKALFFKTGLTERRNGLDYHYSYDKNTVSEDWVLNNKMMINYWSKFNGDLYYKGKVGIGVSEPIYDLSVAGEKIGLNGGQLLYTPNNSQYSLILGNGGNNLTSSSKYNTILGFLSGESVTSGSSNTAIGTSAIRNTTTGEKNIAIGYASMYSNISGKQNTIVGNESFHQTSNPTQNVALGNIIARNTTDAITGNVFVGYATNYYGDSGKGNTSLGYKSLYRNNGDYNIAIGYNAINQDFINGNYNIVIGVEEGVSDPNGSYQLNIGGAITGDLNAAITMPNASISEIDLANGDAIITKEWVNAQNFASASNLFSGNWNDITGEPTTISGYGITDAYTKSETNKGFLSIDYNNQVRMPNTTMDADLLETGFTFLTAPSLNIPNTINGGYLLTGEISSGFNAQLYIGSNDDSFYYRSGILSGTTFGQWYHMATREWVNSQKFAKKQAMYKSITTTTTPYTVVSTDYTIVYNGSTSGDDITIPVPATGNKGRILRVINNSSVSINVIDTGTTSFNLNSNQRLLIQSDGSTWIKL